MTDGPFTETKEMLGGFYLVECATQNEAIEWAKKIPLREDRRGSGGLAEVMALRVGVC